MRANLIRDRIVMKSIRTTILAATALAGGLTVFGIAQAAKTDSAEVVAIMGATVFDATGAAPHLASAWRPRP